MIIKEQYCIDVQLRRKISDLQPLYPPQIKLLNDLQKTLITRQRKITCIYSARQTTKNEVVGESGRFALMVYSKTGGNYMHTGLTMSQCVNSKARIEKFVSCDPLLGYAGKKISI